MMCAGWKLYPKMGYVLILLHFVFLGYTLLTSPIGDAAAIVKLPTIGR